MKRRTFLKTVGKASATALLPPCITGCRTKTKPHTNILWIGVEDISPLMSCYGYDANQTPHLDRLAAGGVRFSNTFMPAPVCSPCRSALITGMMPTTTGVHNHHCSRSEATAVDLPGKVKTLPELFREAGYYTFNHCDLTMDRIRSVRTKQFRYIRNFFPDRPYMQPHYRDERDITQRMRKLHAEGKLDAVQDRFWSEARPVEELYDLQNDPHEIHNLVDNPLYSKELQHHRSILEHWIEETDDKGQYPEDKPNLRYMFDWWGDKCVNPEYDIFKTVSPT